MTRLIIRNSDGEWFLNPRKIVRIEAARQYAKFFLTNKKSITFSGTLKKFMKMLEPTGKFLRIHPSHAVNKHEILRINGLDLLLYDGTILPLAEKYRNAVNAVFNRL